MTNLNKWSKTAADNDDADGSLWPEGMAAGQVNNSARDNMASLARYRDDAGGDLTTGGSGAAYTVATNSGNSDAETLRRGFRICVKVHAANTSTTPTLAIDGGTANAIRKRGGQALGLGELEANAFYDLVYNGAAWEVVSSLGAGLASVADDAAPQLGGDLDLDGHGIAFPGATVGDVTGADTTAVSGTAGPDGNLARWNADGDLVDGGVAVADVVTEALIVAVSDEDSDLAAGTAKVTFRMPYAFTLSAVRASVNTAPTGSAIIVDINEDGATILSTKLTIDAGEKTSATAASAAVISDAALASDAEITIDIDQVGSTVPGKGLKVALVGAKA